MIKALKDFIELEDVEVTAPDLLLNKSQYSRLNDGPQQYIPGRIMKNETTSDKYHDKQIEEAARRVLDLI